MHSYVERYFYFGSFRSSVSNVGPNATMLTERGKLTDIGAVYLGLETQGNVPRKHAGPSSRRPSSWLLGAALALGFVVSFLPLFSHAAPLMS